MTTADSVKAKLQGLIATANAATGNTDTDLTAAVNALVAGFGQGGGEEVFQTANGIFYKKDYVCPEDALLLGVNSSLSGAEHLESFSAQNAARAFSAYYMFESCPNLKKVHLPKIEKVSSYMPFRGTFSVEEVQFGSVGFPVSEISYNFSGSGDLATVTIYVNDDVSIPLAGSPWGWGGATFIYRSATTGEVRTT